MSTCQALFPRKLPASSPRIKSEAQSRKQSPCPEDPTSSHVETSLASRYFSGRTVWAPSLIPFLFSIKCFQSRNPGDYRVKVLKLTWATRPAALGRQAQSSWSTEASPSPPWALSPPPLSQGHREAAATSDVTFTLKAIF